MNLLRTFSLALALSATAAFVAGCASPEQIQKRKLKQLDERRNIELALVGSCDYTRIEGVCVNFYANITTTMQKFALKDCQVLDAACDRMDTTMVCLDPSEKGTAKIQYEFYFPKGTSLETAQQACTGGKRELITL